MSTLQISPWRQECASTLSNVAQRCHHWPEWAAGVKDNRLGAAPQVHGIVIPQLRDTIYFEHAPPV